MTAIKSVPSVPQAAALCGLNHLQQAALERAFARLHALGAPPGDLLRLVSDHVEAARASAGNPYRAKLSPLVASSIRQARKQGASYSELAREHEVSSQSIKRICLGQSYAPILRAVKGARRAG